MSYFSHYVRQLLEAISYCHSHGIIHCNLQPQFVVLASSGNCSPIKLTGFTVARQLGLRDVVHAGPSLTVPVGRVILKWLPVTPCSVAYNLSEMLYL